MLKIYRCTIKYELHNDNKIIDLSTETQYVIRDESEVTPKTKEFGAYTDEAADVYNHSYNFRPTKKGMRASCWTWDSTVYLNEWQAPDAKLVVHLSYEEESCTMKQLMNLKATDVIAYLKQEGLNLLLTN